ncbi:ABC transporter substrate-binding protein [Leifsonia sp. 2TAF2]|uniref:ABC transporter substrate-binding protein n=1 Tax=Leifsonia sp. 2TAF2 TaxID=3233009 RepID=UPI003F9BA397
MAESTGGLVDRFALALERALGIDLVDNALLLRVRPAKDRVVLIHVDAEALAENARRAIDGRDVEGLSGADPVDQFFTLFFLEIEAALASAPRQRVLQFRYTARGKARIHGP